MHQARPLLIPAVVASMMALASAAYGHGESGHGQPKQGQPRSFDPSKAEEKEFGRAGDARNVSRTIHIGMKDTMHFFATASASRESTTDVRMRDAPHAMAGDIVLKRGDTVRFAVHNDGRVMHEMVIGTMKELKEHAELMRKFPNMEHDEPYMAHVAPGKQGEIVWQFTRAGEFHYACLIPGHMEAGMIAKITVK